MRLVSGVDSKILSVIFKNDCDKFCRWKFIGYFFHTLRNKKFRSDYKKFYIFKNRDKTIRWIFPDGMRCPEFLRFYNIGSLRSRAIAIFFKLIFHSRIYKVFYDFILIPLDDLNESVLNLNIPHDSYVVFTGTVGENRKIVISFLSGDEVVCFIKVPITEKSLKNINNEEFILSGLARIDPISFDFPRLISNSKDGYIAISNIRPAKIFNNWGFGEKHIAFMSEMIFKTFKKKVLNESNFYHQICNNLSEIDHVVEIKNGLDFNRIVNLVGMVHKLIDKLKHNVIPMSYAHGDFTPWNIFIGAEKLHIYDWELGAVEFPAMFDLFHYVFQSYTMFNNGGYDLIKNELEKIFNIQGVLAIVEKYSIDLVSMKTLYLSYTISYYLQLYVKQNPIHIQATWLIDNWENALLELMEESKCSPHL